ncbi:hypothetical protein IMG5_011210 [Ichthyophthirius multifiliis]|uniref:adenylate cyclase n=1 Tax=Ichthyophthirius multifiliis TaxID=5932 RepID=G0QK07_ICHMU|nr:hypothetical protein IMG5_011210 [Ichthyophthirius multifiliis]EGR34444.1 hypothetical protein IMG5_011210 [Ichthyophthirius multifiliis]|eukprot:XP_004039748.1 hypothetical protein IMG5_011210 [Ichthyophthirius multifiliis]
MREYKTQNQNILGLLLPDFIQKEVSQCEGQYLIEKSADNVYILFCDICQFDSILSNQQENIIILLDDLFRSFDTLCKQYSIQKIETIGKTYMACGGLKIQGNDQNFMNENPYSISRKMILLAFDMHMIASQIQWQNDKGSDKGIQLKIGIHVGPVIAGVIGMHKPQFSLIGDTVNTASRVCANCSEGKTSISDQVYENVNSIALPEWMFEPFFFEAKGKGLLKCFYVNIREENPVLLHSNSQQQFQMNDVSISQNNRSINSTPQKNSQQQMNVSLNLIQMNQFQVQNINGQQNQNNKSNSSIYLRQGSMNLNNQNCRIPSNNNNEENFPKLENWQQQKRNTKTYDFFKNNTEDLIDLEKTQQSHNFLNLDNLNQQNNIIYTLNEENEEFDNFFILNKYLFTFKKGEKQMYLQFQQNLHKKYVIKQLLLTIIIQFVNFLNIFQSFINIEEFKFNFQIKIGQILASFLIIFGFRNEFILILGVNINFFIQIMEEKTLSLNTIIFSINLYYIVMNFYLKFYQQLIVSFIWVLVFCFQINFDYSIIYFVFISYFFQVYQRYQIMQNEYKTYEIALISQNQNKKSMNLLDYLLPSHILYKFFLPNTKRCDLTNSYNKIPILVADIAGFTDYSNKVSPSQVVKMLSKLFINFDQACKKHKVFKLYTIGDCYIVLGLDDKSNKRNESEEAYNTLEMAFDMFKIIQEVKQEIGFDGLNMRIGIHIGDIIGGVIGTDIVRYDIYGKDVVIANKMESNSEPGKIRISEKLKKDTA